MDETEDVPKDFIKLKSAKLSVDEVSELVVSPYCGAVSLFIGTTRNNFEGKKVIHLEYEAYTSMAETEIKKICRDVRQKWPSVKHIAVYHRLGVVPITEASVIIAVSSPHRAESLEAVMYCINTLKASVPIWKKPRKPTVSWAASKAGWSAGHRSYSAPLLCSDEIPHGLLHPFLESPTKEGCGPVGMHPEDVH
ncbi:PREDICTED: molybdopterin synthase catalytic subunit isoform X1 [Lepidothrix coronata]|uniref:Molybdopterin synthase catalytic subunit n=1 Tax=Lepidothrix coronata TaxID=321398 RepID=A0A6J0GY70_9PASS|nr:PREDICTED: molybdopterin synthase catalytic subunit isoform X1 [Lepidothrix coronata]XP_017666718.1 PREDICTED: molybdopterin synthase catalytic subunit isoform X1 [Lepidothrix coronata]